MTTTTTTTTSLRIPSPPINYDYSVVTADMDHTITLLLDAKTEYHKQLISQLRTPIYKIMKDIYNQSETICQQDNTPENVLMIFQDHLARIPQWDKARRNKEYAELLKQTKCDWLNELIKFTYITHVKILTIVNKARAGVKLSLAVPSGSSFYQSVCVEVARELWKSPFLFSTMVSKYEYQKNQREVEKIIAECVDESIRKQIPMKAILQDYLDSQLTSPHPQTPTQTPPQTPTQKTTQKSINTNTNLISNNPIRNNAIPGKLTKIDKLDKSGKPLDNTNIVSSKTQPQIIKSDDIDDLFEEEVILHKRDNINNSIGTENHSDIEDELEIIEPTIDIDTHYNTINNTQNNHLDIPDIETESEIESKIESETETPLDTTKHDAIMGLKSNADNKPSTATETPLDTQKTINPIKPQQTQQTPIDDLEEIDVDTLGTTTNNLSVSSQPVSSQPALDTNSAFKTVKPQKILIDDLDAEFDNITSVDLSSVKAIKNTTEIPLNSKTNPTKSFTFY